MRLSTEEILAEAEATGFRADLLEKVAYLLGLLNTLQTHPFLKGKLALKGGTALNLFLANVPRLSVDIDLNYVGQAERQAMLEERPRIEEALQAVFAREDFTMHRVPTEHAGGKWRLGYRSYTGQLGNLAVDLNYMYRIPLWPVAVLDSYSIGDWQAQAIPVLDIHELAAGKLAALFARQQARDLFDSYQILQMRALDMARLRLAFVVYGAMSRKDWRTIAIDDIVFNPTEMTQQLVPTLRGNASGNESLTAFGERLIDGCRQLLTALLPFAANELMFLDILHEQGRIDATHLTEDAVLRDVIQRHPGLQWKALNIRKHKG